ncbi:hypothetical protein TNIN_422531 [Trichonephila inaurata madagascariensis]|uniref:Uncharacterized protein n=1 Tax=Trichonephila inaurata madagascariensis TaxID=2747483 RepID=A0A8X6M8N5_9ARAC|nr:hypothetical protein TNIN_422531 [Trichonephila inaurata madagascariensis]
MRYYFQRQGWRALEYFIHYQMVKNRLIFVSSLKKVGVLTDRKILMKILVCSPADVCGEIKNFWPQTAEVRYLMKTCLITEEPSNAQRECQFGKAE